MGDSPVFPLHLSLKIGHDHPAHPHPLAVSQVHLVCHGLTGPPVVKPVLHDVPVGAILIPILGPPNPKGVEVRDVEEATLGVKRQNVVVQQLDLLLPVPTVTLKHLAVVSIPH